MSEQKQSFSQALDAWTDKSIISPLIPATLGADDAKWEATCKAIKKAIQQKVLESFKKGLAAGRNPQSRPSSGFRQSVPLKK